MEKYTAKELSNIAGVSIRTLHYYDSIGLLTPAIRTEKKYRLYGKNELIKLQQIRFYKELNFSLKEILEILNNPNFDIIEALISHKKELVLKQKRISRMLNTIDKTVLNLKGKKMITDNELYDGFTKEQAKKNRIEAVDKYGLKTIETSEKHLKKLSKQQFETLKKEQKEIFKTLFKISNLEPENKAVQLEIAKHYKNTRQFWGTDGLENSQWKAYKGLAKLYEEDITYTKIDGKVQPKFASFLSKAIKHFVITQLK